MVFHNERILFCNAGGQIHKISFCKWGGRGCKNIPFVDLVHLIWEYHSVAVLQLSCGTGPTASRCFGVKSKIKRMEVIESLV